MRAEAMLAAALEYAARSESVFPVWGVTDDGRCGCGAAECKEIGKHPLGRLVPRGFKDATTDEAMIRGWWESEPTANIGTPTDRRFVLDVDPRHGGDKTLHELERQHGALPLTPRVLSGGGGVHYHFAQPTPPLGNSVGKLGPGLDTRGLGGYVLLPPSRHASGQRYLDDADCALFEAPLAPVPAWMLAMLAGPTPTPNGGTTTEATDWAALLAGAPEGERHAVTTRIAGHLLGKRLPESEVIAILMDFAARCSPPYSPADVRRIVHDLAAKDRTRAASSDPLAPLRALPTPPDLEAVESALREVARLLNGADALRLATVREQVVASLGDRGVTSPAKFADAALGLTADRTARAELAGKGITLDDPEPWPEPVGVTALLGELAQLARRFVVLPDGGPETLALWIAFTYTLDAWDTAPQLVLTSPVKQCGKTKCLELATALVRRALPASNLTAAAAYRVIEKYAPTMIVDEADTFLLENSELRGVMNSGHTRATAFVLRCVGDDADPRRFSTWCARAIALIGALPATMEDRSITLPMRRRVAGERIERMRRNRLHRDLEPVRRQLARWTQDAAPALRDADPEIPAGLTDREADNWRPLLAVADLAGGTWPKLARKAALALCGVRGEDATPGLQLLADVREVFPPSERKIASAELVKRLVALTDRQWGEYSKGGKALTQNALAGLLRPFRIRSHNVRIGDDCVAKGYEQKDFDDPFARYLRESKPLQLLQVNERKDLDQKSNPPHDRSVADRKTYLSSDEQTDVARVAVPNPRETLELDGEITNVRVQDDDGKRPAL